MNNNYNIFKKFNDKIAKLPDFQRASILDFLKYDGFSLLQASIILQKQVATIRSYISKGLLTTKKHGKLIIIDKESFYKYLIDNKIRMPSDFDFVQIIADFEKE